MRCAPLFSAARPPPLPSTAVRCPFAPLRVRVAEAESAFSSRLLSETLGWVALNAIVIPALGDSEAIQTVLVGAAVGVSWCGVAVAEWREKEKGVVAAGGGGGVGRDSATAATATEEACEI